MVPGLTYLIFSWRRRSPSWSKMSTLSWYHMIDVVLFFWFFENRETAPHHQKKQQKFFSDTTARKNLFCNCKKSFMSVYVPKSFVCDILLQKFGKSQLQLPHHQNSSQLYHNIFTAIKHGVKEAQRQHRHEGRRPPSS
jgi:hypothetical protein